MNKSNLNSAITVKTINKFILILLLLCLLPTNILPDLGFFSKNINDSVQYYGNIFLVFFC